MDLAAIWRESVISMHLAWTWVKDYLAAHPAMILVALVVLLIIWRLLKPSFE